MLFETEKQMNAYELVCRERRIFVFWIIYHSIVCTAVVIGAFFAIQYMVMPDRVLILGRDRNLYVGNSAPVESKVVLEDISLRTAYALLSRRYDIQDDRQLKMVCTPRGLSQAKAYLNDTQELFEKRMQFQEIENCSVEYSANDGKYFSLVKGTVRLMGIYFGYPYSQKRDFALLMRLERSKDDFELPFKVAGMKLYEEEHIDE